MSYGRAGVALTIAAIILISGVYVRFTYSAPEPDQTFEYDQYPYLKSVKSTSFGIAPDTSKVQTFEGKENQKVSLTVSITEERLGVQQSSALQFRTIVNVTDSTGKELVYDENVGRSYSFEPIRIENGGPVTVTMTNQGDDLIQVSMQLRESGARPNFDYADNSIETFSNWLILISMPVFGLAAMLFIFGHKKKDEPRDTPNPSS